MHCEAGSRQFERHAAYVGGTRGNVVSLGYKGHGRGWRMAAVRGCVPDANLGGRTNHRPTLGRRHIAGLTAGPWLWRPRSAPPGLPQCRCPSMSVALQHGRHPPLDAVPHVQSLSPIAPCNAPDIRPVSPPPTHTPTPTPPRHLQGTPMPSLPPLYLYTPLSDEPRVRSFRVTKASLA